MFIFLPLTKLLKSISANLIVKIFQYITSNTKINLIHLCFSLKPLIKD